MFISRFMTKDVVTLGRDSDIAEAKQLMVRYRIRHLPVTRPDNTLIGMVTDRDIRSAMPSTFTGAGSGMADAGNGQGRPFVGRQPRLQTLHADTRSRLKWPGFNQPLSDVQPDVRLAAAVAADGMALRFAFAFGNDTGCRSDRLLFFQ